MPAKCEQTWQQTCHKLHDARPDRCTPCKKPFCVCKKGFVRSPLGDGQCVSSKICHFQPPKPGRPHHGKCPKDCPKNEECGFAGLGACADTCTHYLKLKANEPVWCPRIQVLHKSCVCKKGWARNGDGVCIPVKKCI